MSKQKLDIVITDDHKLFRKGIASLLEDLELVDKIYEAGNGKELLELLEKTKFLPDLILLDIRMPEMDGIQANEKIRSLYPEIKTIILTMEDNEQFILYMINEGVNGYLQKSADPEELELAIKKVMEMDYYFPDEISTLVFRNLKKMDKTKMLNKVEISAREKKLLEYICREFTTPEIAREMNLSSRTIESYRTNLLNKTGARNMAGLVVFALKNKLVNI